MGKLSDERISSQGREGLERALTRARGEVERLEELATTVDRQRASRLRTDIRKACELAGVPIPDWAQPVNRTRRADS